MIVSNHMTRLIAYLRKRYYERCQVDAATGSERAKVKLAELGVPPEAALIVVHEPHRRLKWSVRALTS